MNNEPLQLNNNGQVSIFRLNYHQKKQLMIAAADRATHGYDKLYPSMRGIFIAKGAMFKSGYIVSSKPIQYIEWNFEIHVTINSN